MNCNCLEIRKSNCENLSSCKNISAAQDFKGRIRVDRRCGNDFLIPGTSDPSECDPDSANFCCSKWGFCGGDDEHCGCPECVNYRDKKK
jgi:hypothetical protein